MELREISKGIRAEWFTEAMHDYSEFYEDFVQTFELSFTQCVALHHLCKLAEKYGEQLAKTESDNITVDELLSICYKEQKIS